MSHSNEISSANSLTWEPIRPWPRCMFIAFQTDVTAHTLYMPDARMDVKHTHSIRRMLSDIIDLQTHVFNDTLRQNVCKYIRNAMEINESG